MVKRRVSFFIFHFGAVLSEGEEAKSLSLSTQWLLNLKVCFPSILTAKYQFLELINSILSQKLLLSLRGKLQCEQKAVKCHRGERS